MISSLDNKSVKNWTKLHQKKYRDNNYLLLNERLVLACRDSGCLDTLIYTGSCPFDFDNSVEVSRLVLDKISKKEGLQFIGVGRFIEEKRNYKNRVLLLDHLQDPLNIGRIMESAFIFEFDSVVLSNESADIYNEKCLNASKGSIFKLNICHGDLLEEISKLKAEGFKICSTGLRDDNTKELYSVEACEKMAFVLGNEGSGVSEEVFDASDEIIKIDMHNIDSLNVAMAGAIVMYHFSI